MPRDKRDDESVDENANAPVPRPPPSLGDTGLGGGGFIQPDEDEDAEDADAPTVIDQRGVFFRDAFREPEKPSEPAPEEKAAAPAAPQEAEEDEAIPWALIALSVVVVFALIGGVYYTFLM